MRLPTATAGLSEIPESLARRAQRRPVEAGRNGKAELVILSVRAYQKYLDLVEREERYWTEALKRMSSKERSSSKVKESRKLLERIKKYVD